MPTNCFIGNLSFDITKEEIAEFLSPVCVAGEIVMINHKETQKFRGFVFVDVGDNLKRVIDELDGTELRGRVITVREAIKKMETRPRTVAVAVPKASKTDEAAEEFWKK